MAREVVTDLIARNNMSGPLKSITVSAEETRESLKKVGPDGAKGMDQVSEAAKKTSESLDRSAVAAGAFGAAILSALVVPIGMGTKAAWDQVDAVEQATLAFRAYETDARKVNDVLADLLTYARSDLGRLFSRQELFAAAQGLKVMGAETENLARYVEIMGRSVSIGAGTWDELTRVIGRVGSTAKLTGVDFEMLQKMGFQLDASLRNQTVTWEQLFDALDKGIGTVSGQTETIRGQLTMTETSVRSLGLAFLQVDSETSQFAEGGLGSLAMSALPTVRDLLASMVPVAHLAGEGLAFLAGGAQLAAEGFLALPQGLQTTIFALVGGVGALAVGGSALVLAFSKLSAAGVALRTTLVSLGTTIRAHPILFIASIVGGIALSAWAKHRDSVQRAQEAYAALGDEIKETDEIIANLKLEGYGAMAAMMEEMRAGYRDGLQGLAGEFDGTSENFMDLLFGDLEAGHTRADAGAKVREFLNSTVGKAALEWAKENEAEFATPILNAMMVGSDDVLAQATPFVQQMMTEYVKSFELDDSQKAIIEDSMNDIFDLMRNPDIDANVISEQFWAAIGDYKTHGNFDQFVADLEAIESGAYKVAEATRAMRADTEWLIELSNMRLSGQGGIADDLVRLQGIMGDNADASERAGLWYEFLFENVKSGDLALDAFAGDLAKINFLFDQGWISQEMYDTMLQNLALHHVDAAEAADVYAAAIERAMTGAAHGAESGAAFIQLMTDNLNALIDVTGYGDPLSRWNIAGNATDMSTLAMNADHAAGSLDSIFRVVVGNTNAIGNQFDQIYKWAEGLIAEEGVWSKLDDLVISGRIEGTIGDFTDGSEYALAQQAYNALAEDNVRLQESILTIQAKQAPLVAEQASAYEELMYQISEYDASQQMIVLGWMDQTTAARAMEFQTLAAAAAMGELGENGEAVFTDMITGAANADPILKALLVDMGLISEGADGEIIVNFDSVSDGKSEIMMLIESIDNLIATLLGIPPAHLTVEDEASGPIQSVIDLINSLPDRRTTVVQTVLETVQRYVGPMPHALGGMVQGYASGGVVIRAGEIGPEVLHFANGGTALLPRDGYYNVPANSYVSPNNAVSNSYGGISVDFSGAVFNNTSRDEMSAWAQDVFIPTLQQALVTHRAGYGM